jgi:hypothetical protein
MAIYDQPNSWQCGPFALKHGLLALGIFSHEDDLSRVARSTEALGTDESQLARAASSYGCDLDLVRRRTARGARRALAAWLARGVPVLLCVDQWDHWVTAVASDADRVVILDSYYPTVLRLEPWSQVLGRLAYRQRRWRGWWTRTVYDLHPLVSRAACGVRLALTPARAEQLLAGGDQTFLVTWDEYARKLLPLAAHNGQRERAVPLDAFLVKSRGQILAEVARLREPQVTSEAERHLDRLIFVAGLYGIRLRPRLELRTVGRIASMVSGLVPAAPALGRPDAEPRDALARSA